MQIVILAVKVSARMFVCTGVSLCQTLVLYMLLYFTWLDVCFCICMYYQNIKITVYYDVAACCMLCFVLCAHAILSVNF
jgi:hypothetical protein